VATPWIASHEIKIYSNAASLSVTDFPLPTVEAATHIVIVVVGGLQGLSGRYQERYRAAIAEFDARDQDDGPDCTPEHDRLSNELLE
jgi:hypothetical protein